MTTTKRIIKNSFFLTGGNVVAKSINLVLVFLLTRLLGSEGFGVYNFAFAYTMIFLLFTHMGISSLMVREIAKDRSRAKEMLGVSLPIVFIFTLLSIGLINLLAWGFGWVLYERQIIAVFSIYMACDGFGRFAFSIFRAFERMEFEALVYICERIGLLIVTVFCWWISADLFFLVCGFTLVMVGKALQSFWLVRKHFLQIPLLWDWERAIAILKEAYPFALMSIFGVMSMRVDTIMLKVFHSAEAVGLYNTARKLVESISFIPENIAFAMFPALSVLFLSDPEKFQQTFERILQYMLIIAIPVMVGANVLADRFINLLFEPEFARAYLALQWLAVWLGLLFLKFTFATTLNAINRQHLFSVFAGISMVLNIALNYWLIPIYDIVGAGIATVVSEGVGVLCIIVAVKKLTKLPKLSWIYPKLLLLTGTFYAAVFYSRDLNLFWVVTGAAIVYFLLLNIFRVVSKSDYLYFQELLRSKMQKPQSDK